ncbi:M3 family oligoendopeptidase [Oceanispirochaeta crateris]|uniref:M3 family oligoendopeptidase n=1 Tax=Oceanispirochaeta crateris TaxID=2518645 RepID=A0A5C1QKZ9_9SPIO|nr:M3 family oligoendopeptidase [Oceanispirochaeta crateris]QEN08008.1 M3 family oligoendopeptidase [Oceanispirochaeta crateris]
MKKNDLPAWDLNMYPGLDSDEYKSNRCEMEKILADLSVLLKKDELWQGKSLKSLEEVIPLLNRAHDIYESLESYTYCSYSVQTDNVTALNALNALEESALPFNGILVRFKNRLADSQSSEKDWKESPILKDYLYFLKESLKEQKFQLSPLEEDLAADLSRSGGTAWGRLQESISSSLKTEWEEGEEKTVTQLRLLSTHADREIRKKAWKKELQCWESMEIPLAAALNGVKGFSHTLNSRRGYKTTLERSTHQAGMSQTTLEAMIGSMKKSLPDFRRFMKAKASAMGLERLSWYDTVAPLSNAKDEWTWDRARGFIIEHFSSLSPAYSDFARFCFDKNWIDAPPRKAKVGGAYCISFPLTEESRIMTNFSGSFSDVSTIAHELGHAWHHEVLKKAPALHRHYPMTLAETASIFSETLVFQACSKQASHHEKASLLDSTLMDSNQVITDILSRFLFEQELMERRSSGEVSPEELKQMMLQAQDLTYGEALSEDERHPWMWAVKGHYYNQDLGFYNFPYAFGLLFALGLYSLYEEMGSDFSELYTKVLLKTGQASAEDCAAEAGIDLRGQAFWDRSLGIIKKQIDEYCSLVQP